MTLENLLSQIGSGTKQIADRYSEYAGPAHDPDHHVYFAYEPAHGHVAAPKHSYGGGHKSGASMSALTLLAFLFFLHILQQCIKDHMADMSSSQPVVVMAASREGDETVSKSITNKMDKTGITKIDDKLNIENTRMSIYKQNKITDIKESYSDNESMDKKQLLKVHTTAHTTKSDDQKYKHANKNNSNRNSYFAGFVSAMDEE